MTTARKLANDLHAALAPLDAIFEHVLITGGTMRAGRQRVAHVHAMTTDRTWVDLVLLPAGSAVSLNRATVLVRQERGQ